MGPAGGIVVKMVDPHGQQWFGPRPGGLKIILGTGVHARAHRILGGEGIVAWPFPWG